MTKPTTEQLKDLLAQWRKGIIPDTNDLLTLKAFFELLATYLQDTKECDVLLSRTQTNISSIDDMLEARIGQHIA